MSPLNTEITEKDYTRFWQNNLQKLEEISQNLDILLNDLEIEYSRFDSIYKKIETDINVLSSIYSSFNNMEGHQYVLKLNAVISEYRKRYTVDGIDFNLLNYLTGKINELREESFNFFPELYHDKNIINDKKKEISAYDHEKRPFKWITFTRNNSWFIVPFEKLDIINLDSTDDFTRENGDVFSVTINGVKRNGRDIFSEFPGGENRPSWLLVINDGESVFGADRTGKKIFAHRDFIRTITKPLNRDIRNSLISGRVRIFGKKHLYIELK